MFTTDGLTFATRVAMSGVPGSTGGEAKGGAVSCDVSRAASCDVSGGEAAAAAWHPAPAARASSETKTPARPRGRGFGAASLVSSGVEVVRLSFGSIMAPDQQ